MTQPSDTALPPQDPYAEQASLGSLLVAERDAHLFDDTFDVREVVGQ